MANSVAPYGHQFQKFISERSLPVHSKARFRKKEISISFQQWHDILFYYMSTSYHCLSVLRLGKTIFIYTLGRKACNISIKQTYIIVIILEKLHQLLRHICVNHSQKEKKLAVGKEIKLKET